MIQETPIPSVRELRKRARVARERMVGLFETRKDLEMVKPYLSVGLARLDQKLDFALTLSKYLKKHGIRNVETLADLLYVDSERLEALKNFVFPCAFEESVSRKTGDTYLLALCNLEWHPTEKKWVESK